MGDFIVSEEWCNEGKQTVRWADITSAIIVYTVIQIPYRFSE